MKQWKENKHAWLVNVRLHASVKIEWTSGYVQLHKICLVTETDLGDMVQQQPSKAQHQHRELVVMVL